MKDLKIDFTSDRPVIDFTQSISGGNQLAQKVFINTATERGTDKIYKTSRGSRLFKDCTSGVLMNFDMILRATIMDSTKCKEFVSQFILDDSKIKEIKIVPDYKSSIERQTMAFKVTANITEGTISEILSI